MTFTSTAPATALDLFDLLAADEELNLLVGRYTLADGTKVPAITCMWTNDSLPPQSRVEGVELIVWRGFGGSATGDLSGGTRVETVLRCYLLQWETPVPMDYRLEEVLMRMAVMLPGCTWEETTLPSVTNGLAQIALKWRNPAIGAC